MALLKLWKTNKSKNRIWYLLPSGNKLQGCDLISEIHVDPEPHVEGKGVLHSLS